MSQKNICFKFLANQFESTCSGGYETILHHSLDVKNVDNSALVAQFLGLNKETYLNFSINRSTALEACLDFMDGSISRGFKAFVNVSTVCHVENNDVYGNNYIVACKTNDGKLERALKSKTHQKYYKSTDFTGSCRVLINYKSAINCEISDFLYHLFPQNGDQNERKHISLGVFDETWQKDAPGSMEEMKSLTVLRKAQRLLKAISGRLGEPSFEPNSYESSVEAVKKISQNLSTLATKLQHETNPIVIKNMLIFIAKDLTSFIQHFCYVVWELHCKKRYYANNNNLNAILTNIENQLSTVKYVNYNGLWCIKNKHSISQNHFIQVPEISATWFYNALNQTQSKALLPVIINSDCKNSEITYHVGRAPKCISVTCFEPLTDPFYTRIDVQRDIVTFQHPCYCPRSTKKLWLCSRCNEFLKVSNSGYIVCSCGKGDRSSMKLTCARNCSIENLLNIIPTPMFTGHHTKRVADENVGLAQITNGLSETTISKSKATSYTAERPWERTKIIYETPPPQKPKEIPPGKKVYTVVVVGASGAGKSTLLNSIYAMQKHSDFQSAKSDTSSLLRHDSNEAPPGIGQSVTQHPKDYIIDFGSCVVRFVDTPGTNDTRGIEKDADNVNQIRDFLMQLPEIHAIMFVVKNDECKLSPEFENTLRSLLGLFPRHALRNCCFINTFSAQTNFQPGAVQTALQTFMDRFNNQHSLEPDTCLNFDNQFCVDNAATAAILDEKERHFPLDTYEPDWNKTRAVITEFFHRLGVLQPVKNAEFRMTSKMEQLGYKLLPHIRNNLNSGLKRLMATIASTSVTGIAIYCRNRTDGAAPLEKHHEWLEAAEQWDLIDVQVGNLLREIYDCVRHTIPHGI